MATYDLWATTKASDRSWTAQAREVERAEPGGRRAGRRRARDPCGEGADGQPVTRRGQDARGESRQDAGLGGSGAGRDAGASSAGGRYPPGAGRRSRGSGRAAGERERVNGAGAQRRRREGATERRTPGSDQGGAIQGRNYHIPPAGGRGENQLFRSWPAPDRCGPRQDRRATVQGRTPRPISGRAPGIDRTRGQLITGRQTSGALPRTVADGSPLLR